MPLGSLQTVRSLTGLPINYFITVNFRGFMDLVNNLGGVWVDVDHRYLCNSQNCPDVTPIDLQPGYQRLRATQALAYVRFRHLDSDLYRVARQQLFLKALKQQITSSLGLGTLLDIIDAVEKNVVIGRGGNKALDLQTIKDYVYFARSIPPGHLFQAKIDGLTGYAELSAPAENIAAAVRDFVRPDVSAPDKARDVALGIKRRSTAPRPRDVTITVLNGNGIAGSAANAAYELDQRGYEIVLPPDGNASERAELRLLPDDCVLRPLPGPLARGGAEAGGPVRRRVGQAAAGRAARHAVEWGDDDCRRRPELPWDARSCAGGQDAEEAAGIRDVRTRR